MTREHYVLEIRFALGMRAYHDAALLVRRLVAESGPLNDYELATINRINDGQTVALPSLTPLEGHLAAR